jgi:hypothetical protein
VVEILAGIVTRLAKDWHWVQVTEFDTARCKS